MVALASALVTLFPGIAAAQNSPPQFSYLHERATATSITVSATINPEGEGTTYFVNYGTTPAYGSSTPPRDAGSGTSSVTVAVTISGLTVNTTYDVQLVLTSAAGTTTSPNLTDFTSGAPSYGYPPTTVVSNQHFVRVAFRGAAVQYQTLSGVACVSTKDCFAVGDGGPAPSSHVTTLVEASQLIAHFTGANWSMMATPRLAQSALLGVTCVSAANCMAVGLVNYSHALTALSEHWNGRSWIVERIPAPVSSENSVALNGVACASASECFAVGGANLGTGADFPVILRWNGGAWTSMAVTNAPKSAYLTSVSCLNASDCYAVGSHGFPQTTGVLIEHWNGRSWTNNAVSGVAPGPALSLAGVSCRSAVTCWAVGAAGSGGPLFLRMLGGRWRVVPGVSFRGGSLQSVACATASDCWAVGTAGPSAAAENFNGTRWLLATTAKVATKEAFFSGIACPSTTCVAVGGAGASTAQAGLVEQVP